ncbi:MAG: ATP-binding cassette domain-containing protein, partial [Mycoplasmataceae bacterium]|nr:ATP-binding cassette domain-containing protein [Mycoplasmataceae bacterium]
NGTVFEYLTSNDKIKKDNLLINIEKYKLLDLFEKLNLNLHTNIEDNCKNLSFGQKQFISIMRLFTFDYSLILLDEVFENFEDNFLKQLFLILKNHLKNKIVIEVSHRKNYLFKSNSIDCNLFK